MRSNRSVFQPEPQRILWEDLNTTIRECGAWTTTEKGVFPLRFECEPSSQLPDALRQCGHGVRFLGTHERHLPQTITEVRGNKTVVNQQVAPGVVEVHELSLMADG
jgi:hypothetical protein